MKRLLSISNSMNFSSVPFVKTVKKKGKIAFCYTFNPFFGIWGSFDKKWIFENNSSFWRENYFDTKLILSKHPKQFVVLFSPLCLPIFLKKSKLPLISPFTNFKIFYRRFFCKYTLIYINWQWHFLDWKYDPPALLDIC